MSGKLKHKQRSQVTRSNNYTVFNSFKFRANLKQQQKAVKKTPFIGKMFNKVKNAIRKHQDR